MSTTTLRCRDDAFRRGFRDGVRSVVVGGRVEAPYVIVRRVMGSAASDRTARHRDMEVFGADVRRRRRDVVET
jgi:hypothetical protein